MFYLKYFVNFFSDSLNSLYRNYTLYLHLAKWKFRNHFITTNICFGFQSLQRAFIFTSSLVPDVNWLSRQLSLPLCYLEAYGHRETAWSPQGHTGANSDSSCPTLLHLTWKNHIVEKLREGLKKINSSRELNLNCFINCSTFNKRQSIPQTV